MTTKFFRAPGSRIEHLTANDVTTLCGRDARLGARYTASDNRVDSKNPSPLPQLP